MKKKYTLNIALHIAQKISFPKNRTYTKFIVRLSIAATAISVASIIITLAIVNGFQKNISEKVYQFWGNIRIDALAGSKWTYDSAFQYQIASTPGIVSVQPYLSRAAVISFGQDVEGVLAKGIDVNQRIPFIKNNTHFTRNNLYEVVISETQAKKLHVKLNDEIRLYTFSQANITNRKFKVIGFYHSGIDDYDMQFVILPLPTLQLINNEPNQIDGYSIQLKQYDESKKIVFQLNKRIPENTIAASIEDISPQIFDWIHVQNTNRNVTITILLIIAIVNLITCLLILILERVNMIGSLVAMGASTHLLRQIFLYQSSFIAWIGILLGSILGLGLCFVQMHFQWIHLDETAYFMNTLPIYIKWNEILYVILGTAIISYASFMLPTFWIKRISPSKAIRFQ